MLESAKDRILGVDTLGQYVPPRVQYVIILCNILCDLAEPHGARGDVCAGNLSTASGTIVQETVAKYDILL
jgi:hypothetical protein